MPVSAAKWADRFRKFAELECRGISPLYETVSLGIARDSELLEWIAGVMGPRAHPTLPFAAVHYLLLSSADRDEPLAAFYANLTDAPSPSAAAYPAFRAFVDRERGRLAPLLTERVTQTNEVGRCTYLLPAYVFVASRCRKPLWIIDVGASAGLNLQFDRYAYDYGDGTRAGDPSSAVRLRTELRGNPVSTAPLPEIAGRAGVDLAPIDLDDAAATRWLEACVWPEHVERLRNLRAALDLARVARPRVVKGNAVDQLPSLVAEADRNATVVIVNTNVLLYFSADERARFGRLLTEFAASREMFWIANELHSIVASIGFTAPMNVNNASAALPLVMSRFNRSERDDIVLGSVGPHGRWLDWYA